MKHDHPFAFTAEELQIDEEAELALADARFKAIAWASYQFLLKAALALGIALFIVMAARCVPPVVRHFTASPAPRSLVPSAIANPQPRAFEADARPTYRVR